MSRRADLLAKSAGLRSTAEISAAEVDAERENYKPRSGQGSFAQRQRLEDRVLELESQLAQGTDASFEVPIEQLEPNPWQPRRQFNQDDLDALALSINSLGLIQPVVVRSVPKRDTFQIIAGERRYRACKQLGLQTIKVIALDVSDKEMAAYALAENIERAELSDYEIALSLKAAEPSYKTITELANAIGLSRQAYYRFQSFFKLPDFVLNDLEQTPALLGANAAEALATTLNEGGKAIDRLKHLWEQLKTGRLQQGQLAPALAQALVTKTPVRVEREIKKLFVGKHQAGSITRDAAALTIKFKAAALSAKLEADLRDAVQKVFDKHQVKPD